MKEITLYLGGDTVYFKVGEKPMLKYNFDHGIHKYYIDKVVEDVNVYIEIGQVVIWFDDSYITYYNATWSKETLR